MYFSSPKHSNARWQRISTAEGVSAILCPNGVEELTCNGVCRHSSMLDCAMLQLPKSYKARDHLQGLLLARDPPKIILHKIAGPHRLLLENACGSHFCGVVRALKRSILCSKQVNSAKTLAGGFQAIFRLQLQYQSMLACVKGLFLHRLNVAFSSRNQHDSANRGNHFIGHNAQDSTISSGYILDQSPKIGDHEIRH